jgi:hypothetical protein
MFELRRCIAAGTSREGYNIITASWVFTGQEWLGEP